MTITESPCNMWSFDIKNDDENKADYLTEYFDVKTMIAKVDHSKYD